MPPPTLIPSPFLLRSLRLSLSSKPSLSPPLSSSSSSSTTTTTTTTTRTHQPLPLHRHHRHHHPQPPHRTLHTSPPSSAQTPPSPSPNNRDRGPPSQETTQTDFSAMDIYTHTPPPTSQIDACLPHGFHLSNGVKIGNHSGLLLVGGEAFAWTPWLRDSGGASSFSSSSSSSSPTAQQQQHDMMMMVNAKGEWMGSGGAEDDWGLLRLVWPKPELLILGVGGRMRPLAREARRAINGLGLAVEVQDTGNAAAQFNLLATERGVKGVAAALVPVGWGG